MRRWKLMMGLALTTGLLFCWFQAYRSDHARQHAGPTSPPENRVKEVSATETVRQPKAMRRAAVTRRAEEKEAAGTVTEKRPYDKPGEATAFFLHKRLPAGKTIFPTEKYLAAAARQRKMGRHAAATDRSLRAGTTMSAAAATLDTWTSLGPGNIGGRTRAIVFDPHDANIIYLGAVGGGVWKTTNGGASWQPLTDMMANIAVCSLAMSPTDSNVLYAGTGEGYFNTDAIRGAGIFKTTDGGLTWAQLPTTNDDNFYYVNDIVVSPTDSQHVYAATQKGVFRSLDGGATWTRVRSASGKGCTDLVIRTDQPTDYLLAACDGSSWIVYRNTDAGGAGTWVNVLSETGMARTSLALAPSNQDIVYAAAAGGDDALHAIFRTTTGGGAGSWTAQVRKTDPNALNRSQFTSHFGGTSLGWYANTIAVDPADANRVWTGGLNLMRSDDGGVNWGWASYWSTGTLSQYVHADQHAIAFPPGYDGVNNQTLYATNDGGIFRTNNARAATAMPSSSLALNWTALNNGYAVTQFYYGLPYPDGTTYFGGTQDNGTVRGTDSSGANAWQEILSGDGGYVAVDPTNTNVLYAEFNDFRQIQKSTNGGNSFSYATTGLSGSGLFITPFLMDPNNAQRLWTGGRYVFRTTNGAANWTQASTAFTSGYMSAIAIAPADSNYALAGTEGGAIHRTPSALTATSSTTWPSVQPRNGYVSGVTFDPLDKNIAYATYSTFGGTHVWKSTDAGANWSPLDGAGAGALPDIPVHCLVVDPTNTQRLFIGTDSGVFVSTDGGANWAVENTGFANAVTESLSMITTGGVTKLFAFTHGRGAWRVTVGASTPQPCPTGFTVNTLADTPDATPGDGLCADANGQCSLRAAVEEANALTSCPALTINFGNNTWGGTITLTSELPINQSLTIQGPGANLLTVSGNNAVRVFQITASAVTLSSLTIANGRLTNSNNFGGGIHYTGAGTLTLQQCTVSGNSLLSSGTSYNVGAGGGIFNAAGTINLTACTLSGNTAAASGTQNNVGAGGGIYNAAGRINLTACTLSGNSASSSGSSSGGGTGGAIFNEAGTVTLTACTLSGNAASNSGGGMAGTATVRNTILAGNTANTGPDGFGDFTSQGYNLIGKNEGSTGFDAGQPNANQDLVGTSALPVDPLLGSLANNGGPTKTMALLVGSPALDQGQSFGLSADQRGQPRPSDNPARPPALGGDNSDIGAFEAHNTPPIARCQAITVAAGAGCVADAAINDGSYDPDSSDPLTITQSPPGPYPLGITEVTLTVTDNNGASSSCTTTVTVVDQTAPDTSLTSVPGQVSGANVSFSFTGTDNCSVSFACRLDSGDWTLCTSGQSYSALSNGAHTFQVRAKDAAGNVDATPASYDWQVFAATCGTVVNPATLPTATRGTPFVQTLSASPTGSYVFSLFAGTLPPGIKLVNTLGIYSLRGTPTTAGSYTFTIKASKANSTCVGARTYTLVVP